LKSSPLARAVFFVVEDSLYAANAWKTLQFCVNLHVSFIFRRDTKHCKLNSNTPAEQRNIFGQFIDLLKSLFFKFKNLDRNVDIICLKKLKHENSGYCNRVYTVHNASKNIVEKTAE
jgi:hypothetical protein